MLPPIEAILLPAFVVVMLLVMIALPLVHWLRHLLNGN
jgi:hypothetical protein